MNASYEGSCVEFERKTTQHWFLPTFKLLASSKKRFMIDLLNIIFDDFGV